jgi:hypothetical protein
MMSMSVTARRFQASPREGKGSRAPLAVRGRSSGARSVRRLSAFLPIAALWSGYAWAQAGAPLSDDEISKETENPVSRQIQLPLRYEADFAYGATESTKENFVINNAIVPFVLDEDWALITRTKLPLLVQPPKKDGQSWQTGLGNGYTEFFLSPEHGQGFYWGVGPILYYPSMNSTLGVNRWGSGPAVGFVKKDESPWEFGGVAAQIWSIGGPTNNGTDRTNQLMLNPAISYHFGDGWALGSSPTITGNWAASGGHWTVPVGGGVSKTFRIDDQPLKLAFDSYYNAIRPVAGQQTWLTQVTLTFVFPSWSASAKQAGNER